MTLWESKGGQHLVTVIIIINNTNTTNLINTNTTIIIMIIWVPVEFNQYLKNWHFCEVLFFRPFPLKVL